MVFHCVNIQMQVLSRGAVYYDIQGTADEILKCDHSNESY